MTTNSIYIYKHEQQLNDCELYFVLFNLNDICSCSGVTRVLLHPLSRKMELSFLRSESSPGRSRVACAVGQ